MYRGNMGDFIKLVDLHLRDNYDCKIIFGIVPSLPGMTNSGNYYVAFFAPQQGSAIGYTVYDREDFEQQIYDYVNKELEYVQGKYDGFPEPFAGISGEDF